MFIYTLPYSREEFSIKPILFKNIIDIARLIYDDNDKGLANYLESLLGIEKLCIVDKFFVVLKAKQIFIDDQISINCDSKNVNISVNLVLAPLFEIEKHNRVFENGNIVLELDFPRTFITSDTSDIYQSIIKSISIDETKVLFYDISNNDKDLIISKLPALLVKDIISYLKSAKLEYSLFDSLGDKIPNIYLNFFSNDPFNLIKNIFSVYDVFYYRDILVYLSSKIDTTAIYNSTIQDLSYFIEEIEKRRSSADNSGNNIPNI